MKQNEHDKHSVTLQLNTTSTVRTMKTVNAKMGAINKVNWRNLVVKSLQYLLV